MGKCHGSSVKSGKWDFDSLFNSLLIDNMKVSLLMTAMASAASASPDCSVPTMSTFLLPKLFAPLNACGAKVGYNFMSVLQNVAPTKEQDAAILAEPSCQAWYKEFQTACKTGPDCVISGVPLNTMSEQPMNVGMSLLLHAFIPSAPTETPAPTSSTPSTPAPTSSTPSTPTPCHTTSAPSPCHTTSTPTPCSSTSGPTTSPITDGPTQVVPTVTPCQSSAAPSPVKDCTEVSVVGDATYCIQGPICVGSGLMPAGNKCPVKGDMAKKDCHSNLPSASNGQCVAPKDATCQKIPSGAWGCVWGSDSPVPTPAASTPSSGPSPSPTSSGSAPTTPTSAGPSPSTASPAPKSASPTPAQPACKSTDLLPILMQVATEAAACASTPGSYNLLCAVSSTCVAPTAAQQATIEATPACHDFFSALQRVIVSSTCSIDGKSASSISTMDIKSGLMLLLKVFMA